MLNLYDYLSEKDNKIIENYIHSYGVEDGYIGNEAYLKNWKESKPKMFHVLGGNLIVKFPFEFAKNTDQLEAEFAALRKTSQFVKDFDRYLDDIRKTEDMSYGTYCLFYDTLSLRSLTNDSILNTIKYKSLNSDKTLQLQAGMKPMRAVQKIIKYFNMPEEIVDGYEQFRIDHSMILNEKIIKGNVCISIHPMDFMTMSDNASGWTSCMSWAENGCYHVGTVEMMNSNCVVCAYIDSKIPMTFGNKEDEYHTWNNKKWRQLFYVTKDIIVAGKAYPYYNENFTKFVLEKLRDLAKENCGWSYSFGPELYKDMIHIGSAYRMDNNRYWLNSKQSKKHNILFDSKGMYNDMLNDQDYRYWCIRNKVDKMKIISYSGKNNCLCCNKTITYENDDDYYYYDEGSYNSRFSDTGYVICWDCRDSKKCTYCGNDNGWATTYDINGKKYCKKCIDKIIRKCPECNEAFVIPDYMSDPTIGGIRLTDSTIYSKDIRYKFEKTRFKGYLLDSYNHNAFVPVFMCKSCLDKKISDGFFKRETFPLERSEPPWASLCKNFPMTPKVYKEDDPSIKKYLFQFLQKISLDNLD